MKDIAVIFDFNGTMFFDGNYHDEAWRTYIEEMTSKQVSDIELVAYIKGKTPRNILEHFLGNGLSDNMIYQFSLEKECIYRNILAKHRETARLAPGLEKYLGYLKDAGVPMAIATTADMENMKLYNEIFGLDNWFEWDKIIYNDGNIKLKPEPDAFEQAIKSTGVKASHCLAFEDSVIGVNAAVRAGIKNVIAVTGDSWNINLANEECVIAMIKDFTELNDRIVIKDNAWKTE